MATSRRTAAARTAIVVAVATMATMLLSLGLASAEAPLAVAPYPADAVLPIGLRLSPPHVGDIPQVSRDEAVTIAMGEVTVGR